MVNAEASIHPLCYHFAFCKDLADKKMEYRLVARGKLLSDAWRSSKGRCWRRSGLG